MSLNAEEKVSIEKLTRANYPTWIEKVKDYILALEHDDAADIWQAFVWVRDPNNPDAPDPAEHDYQAAANQQARKLRVQHNKAYRFIRNALSPEVFNTTLRLPHNVPKLLRPH